MQPGGAASLIARPSKLVKNGGISGDAWNAEAVRRGLAASAVGLSAREAERLVGCSELSWPAASSAVTFPPTLSTPLCASLPADVMYQNRGNLSKAAQRQLEAKSNVM